MRRGTAGATAILRIGVRIAEAHPQPIEVYYGEAVPRRQLVLNLGHGHEIRREATGKNDGRKKRASGGGILRRSGQTDHDPVRPTETRAVDPGRDVQQEHFGMFTKEGPSVQCLLVSAGEVQFDQGTDPGQGEDEERGEEQQSARRSEYYEHYLSGSVHDRGNLRLADIVGNRNEGRGGVAGCAIATGSSANAGAGTDWSAILSHMRVQRSSFVLHRDDRKAGTIGLLQMT
mmetsp:Transcript_50456/g.151968  ORF Transcript_50456/g.151968 Transcript_50456/m.151968 type:complete len:231 (+) Transcript_50456:1039-1731(+)